MGYGVNESATETKGKNDLNKNLIKRFNFHSTMILKSILGSDTINDTSTTNRLESNDDDDNNVSKRVRLLRTQFN
jgi:hypothetical protein